MSYLQNFLVGFFQQVHGFIHYFIPSNNISYGLAIITFTLIVRLFLLPLNIKQTKSQARLQLIQPEIQKVQAKYKNDPQKSQQEMMKLYKEHKANPMSGCLPILIQMPILFAMYYVYYNAKELNGVSFLWLADLGSKDQFYILPFLSMTTTYISSILIAPKGDSPQSKQMSSMNIIMAIFIGFTSLQFRSALVLYWVVNNTIQITQTLVLKKLGIIGKPITPFVDANDKQAAREVSTDRVKRKRLKKS